MMKFAPIVLSGFLCVAFTGILTQCTSEATLAAGTLQANDNAATALYKEGLDYYSQGKLSKAKKRMENLVENHSLALEVPEAYLKLGDIQLEDNEPVKAFEAYDKMLKNYPNSPLYSEGLKKLENLAFDVADGKIKNNVMGLYNTSVGTRDTILMLMSVHENAPYAPSAAKALLKVGEVYERIGQSDAAIETYHKIVDDYPRGATAPYAQYAVAHNYLTRIEEGSKNTAFLKLAQDSYEDFLYRYPKHELASKVKDELGTVMYKLAAVNLENAQFYQSVGNMPAAIFHYQAAANDRYNDTVRNAAKDALDKLGVSVEKPKKR